MLRGGVGLILRCAAPVEPSRARLTEPGQHLPLAGFGLGSSGRAQIPSSPEQGHGADTEG